MTNQTEHHAEAILRAAVPEGWMYQYGQSRIVRGCPQPHFTGYTETPLYPASAILDAVQAERAAIVAWLRDGPAVVMTKDIFSDFANAIKRGEHLPQDTPQ